MEKYSKEIEAKMQLYFAQLSEKDKRHYAAVEALKLGRGGKAYIGKLFNLSQFRIRTGEKELNNPDILAEIPLGKQRRSGGGRKKKMTKEKHRSQLHALLEKYKAGSPTDPSVYFICLTPKELSQAYYNTYGVFLGIFVIRRELHDLGYKYRKLKKTMATGEYKDRDRQFKNIFEIVDLTTPHNPMMSMDGKKKERLGNLYRDGLCLCTDYLPVYDHDYSYLSSGKVIPHGIYDLQLNKGYISIGASSETAEFIIDNLLWWWTNHGIHQYPDAQYIMLMCDCGGGNSYRHHAFKKQLQKLAKEIGIDIIVCHYPPYCSKWNPIEHRLFCHVHRAMSGVLFSSYEVVQKAIAKTTTKTGLTVVVRLNLKKYKTGIKTTKDEIDQSRIKFHETIPKLNYKILS